MFQQVRVVVSYIDFRVSYHNVFISANKILV